MFRLSNGHEIRFVAASGSLGFDGEGWLWEKPFRWLGLIDPSLFTVAIKTITLTPRRGFFRWHKPYETVRFIRNGVLNAMALPNLGLEGWDRIYGPKVLQSKSKLVASIVHNHLGGLREMADRMAHYPFVALEFNASCPNVGPEGNLSPEFIRDACAMLRDGGPRSRLPLIVKVAMGQDFVRIARETEGLVEAISLNSVPWSFVFPDEKSPMVRFGGGGVSGKAAQKITWEMVRVLKSVTQTPVIAPSAWEFEDIRRLKELGADAISFGSLFLRYPWRPTRYVRRWLSTGAH
ncbi:MAG: hypothetical protein HYS57_01810 [Parcubacteria group bacterium]|nr:hypothetical protein [Parcubacteria group bacterium]